MRNTNDKIISKEDSKARMAKLFEEAVQAVKDTVKNVENANIYRIRESSISFATRVNTPKMDFNYSGKLEFIDVDKKFPFLVFRFKQNGLDQIDSAEELVNIAFIPDSLANIKKVDSEFENDLKSGGAINYTTSFNAFMSSVIDCIKGYSK